MIKKILGVIFILIAIIISIILLLTIFENFTLYSDNENVTIGHFMGTLIGVLLFFLLPLFLFKKGIKWLKPKKKEIELINEIGKN